MEAKIVDYDFVMMKMHPINLRHKQLWQKTCPARDDEVFLPLIRLMSTYENMTRMQQLQKKAEKVLKLDSVQYGSMRIDSTGFVELIFKQKKEPPLPSFFSESCIDRCGVIDGKYYIRILLTEQTLCRLERWIDREEARQLLASKLKYLTGDLGINIQIWNDLVIANVSCGITHRSLEHEMTMEGINELLREIDKMKKT